MIQIWQVPSECGPSNLVVLGSHHPAMICLYASSQVYGPGVVFVANLRVLGVLGGGRIPSIDSSPNSKEFCRYGRLFFKKGTRRGCGAESTTQHILDVNVSGSFTPSIKLWIKFRTFSATAGGFSSTSFCKVTKKFLHLCLAVLGDNELEGTLGGGLGIGLGVLTGTCEGVTTEEALTPGTVSTLGRLLIVDPMLVAVLTVGVPALGPTLTIWYCPVFVLARKWPVCPVGILWPGN